MEWAMDGDPVQTLLAGHPFGPSVIQHRVQLFKKWILSKCIVRPTVPLLWKLWQEDPLNTWFETRLDT